MSGKILNFGSKSNLCHISLHLFYSGEIWQYLLLIWTMAILIMEWHETPLDVQCKIEALPEYAPRLALGIIPEAKD